MNISECRTVTERDVLHTYRRHLRRKGATPFGAQGTALAEELAYGAVLSPEFVERFTDIDGGACRVVEDGRVRITPHGREVMDRIVSTVEAP